MTAPAASGQEKSWRDALRASLRKQRMSIPANMRRAMQTKVAETIEELIGDLTAECVGFYWPFGGEVDLRPMIDRHVRQGGRAALPVVIKARQPLEFWAWRPDAPMRPGVWNIPIPAQRSPVEPTLLLVPLLGFDRAGYRLGYGGGYYDRTLAAMRRRPLVLGVGFDLARIATIRPLPHDIPMDVIVTESGIYRFADRPLNPRSNPSVDAQTQTHATVSGTTT